MMSKLVLFVCLVLGTVYANTQIRVVNAQYDTASSTSPGLIANLNDYVNITNLQQGDLYGVGDSDLTIPASAYQPLPIYAFVIGTPITISVFNVANFPQVNVEESAENITLVENQSYSFVYIAKSNEESSFSAIKDVPTMLLPFEERPDPSPFGKALLRIVNIAVSTYNGESMQVNVTGTGVTGQVVTLAFAEASEFLEYDSAVSLTLEFTLPLDVDSIQRSLSVTTVVNTTQVVYIRGDIGDGNHLGSLTESVAFAFPAAPTPVAPPTAEPVSEPMADTPTAPTAAPTTVPAARTPTKRVSSAAQTVAQVAGVAALVSLLF